MIRNFTTTENKSVSGSEIDLISYKVGQWTNEVNSEQLNKQIKEERIRELAQEYEGGNQDE